MKKGLLMLAMVAAAVCAQATDSYIYWMMDSMPSTFAEGGMVCVRQGNDTYLTFGTTEYDAAVAQTGFTYQNLLDVGSAVGSTYVFELWNDGSADPSFATRAYTYSELVNMGAIASTEHATAMHLGASDFNAVPEPTSGLMMLLGFALLGLKRKKA